MYFTSRRGSLGQNANGLLCFTLATDWEIAAPRGLVLYLLHVISQETVFALFPGLILDKACKSLFIFDKILKNGLFTKCKPSTFIKIHQLKIIHTEFSLLVFPFEDDTLLKLFLKKIFAQEIIHCKKNFSLQKDILTVSSIIKFFLLYKSRKY